MKIHRFWMLFVLAGCDLSGSELDPVDDSADCSLAGGEIAVVVNPRFSVTPVSGTIRVSGTARHPRSLAIRRVLVGSVPATSASFNFSTWYADLSAEDIARVASTDAGPTEHVNIPVLAYDVCDPGSPRGASSFDTSVLAAASTRVRQITLLRSPESSTTNGAAPLNTEVDVEVRANGDAAGVTVQLTLTPGSTGASFAGGAANTTVVLTPSDGNAAVARVALSGSTPGVAAVTATAGGIAQVLTVRFIGPPLVLPASQGLQIGQRAEVNVLSDGRIEDCDLTPASSTAFTVEGFTSAGHATVASGRATFAFTRTATTGPEMTISCRDQFNQIGRAVVRAAAAGGGG